MKLNVQKVSTDENIFSTLSTNSQWNDLKVSENKESDRYYFNLYLIDPLAKLQTGDWVLLTDYDEGISVTEKCKSIEIREESSIFHGESGSRWPAQDAEKIIATSDRNLHLDIPMLQIDFLNDYVRSGGSINEVTIETAGDLMLINSKNEIKVLTHTSKEFIETDETSELPF